MTFTGVVRGNETVLARHVSRKGCGRIGIHGDIYMHLCVQHPQIPVVMELFKCDVLSAKDVQGPVVKHGLMAAAWRRRIRCVNALPLVFVNMPLEQLVVYCGGDAVAALGGRIRGRAR